MIASLAFRNVLRNKERSLLTLCGVVLAIGSFVALVSLAAGFTQRVERELGSRNVHIYVSGARASNLPASPLAGAGGSGPMLSTRLGPILAEVEGVRSVTPVIRAALDSQRSVIPVLGLPLEDARKLFRGARFEKPPEKLETLTKERRLPTVPRPAPTAEPIPDPSGSPTPQAAPPPVPAPEPSSSAPLDKYSKTYPMSIGRGLERDVKEAIVDGTLVVEEIQFYAGTAMWGHGFLDYIILAPIESFFEQRPDRGVNEFWVVLDNEAQAERLLPVLQQKVTEFVNSEQAQGRYAGSRRIKVRTSKQYLNSARDYLGYGWMLQVAVAMVGVLIAITASMNTMLMSTYERLGEYATLRAVGASRRVIAMTIIYEAIFLNVTGGALGLLFGYLATGVLDHAVAIILEIPYPMSGVTPALLLQALGLSFGVGLCGSIIPIFIVSRLDLVAQLRKGM